MLARIFLNEFQKKLIKNFQEDEYKNFFQNREDGLNKTKDLKIINMSLKIRKYIRLIK